MSARELGGRHCVVIMAAEKRSAVEVCGEPQRICVTERQQRQTAVTTKSQVQGMCIKRSKVE